MKFFDVFESEKIGTDKKSLAINLTFLDEEKTLTDKEIDSMMNRIMLTLEKELKAEIRKAHKNYQHEFREQIKRITEKLQELILKNMMTLQKENERLGVS